MDRYEGTCDACGEAISLDHDPTQGIVDIWVEDETVGTWIRHIQGPSPDCDVYFSKVTRVTGQDKEGCNGGD